MNKIDSFNIGEGGGGENMNVVDKLQEYRSLIVIIYLFVVIKLLR